MKTVPNEGLVYDTTVQYDASERERMLALRNEGKRGNLYIQFDIEFPKVLSKHQKTEIESLLKA